MKQLNERPYRLCAGIMLINEQKNVFVGQRFDMKTEAWQMPQGGIDEGETPEQAAFRELLEEVGTDKAKIIKAYPQPLDYDLPEHLADKFWGGKYRGQRQYWFLMEFTGTDADINLQTEHPEFSEYKWINPQELPHHAIAFKKEIYQTLVEGFSQYLEI